MLISINGLYGSGGNELGWALSEKTGWPVHDNELIRQAVADSGVDLREATLAFYDEDEQGAEQRPYGSAVLSLELDVLPIARDEDAPKKENYQSGLLAAFMDTTSVNNREGIPAVRDKADIDSLRASQTAAVLKVSESGDGIFFGRCSSYILRNRNDTLRLFISASLDSCARRVAAKYGIRDSAEAKKLVKETNRRRAYYYEAFTGLTWDDPENYDFCLNTDYLGFDGTLALLLELIEKRGAML
jgi:cytidylate kinase